MRRYRVVVITTLLLFMVGCTKEEGPMEKMGKNLDDATQSVEKSAEDAADKIKEAVNE